MKNKKNLLLLLFLFVTTNNGCSEQQEEKKINTTKFTMQSAWVNDAEFLGYFTAIKHKYYEDEGLKLEYLPGGPEVIPEASLLSGRADIALTALENTANLIQKDNIDFKIIGAQYQKSPMGIVSLKKSNIRTPKDLIGKTLAVPSVNILAIKAFFKLNNIDEKKVKIVPYQYDPAPLIEGKVDATVDFVTNVPFSIKQAGFEPYSFLLYDYGFTLYSDTIVVTENTLREKRKEIVGWLKASQKGWKQNFKDTEKYPQLFMKDWFSQTGRKVENEIYFNKEQKPLIQTNKGIFHMSKDDIKANIKTLKSVGITISENVFVTDLLNE